MVDFNVSGEASIDPDKIVSDVDAIISKLDDFMAKVDEVDEKLDEMSQKNLNISVVIDGMDKLDELRLSLDELEEAEHEITLHINITGTDDLDKLYLEILELELTDHTVKVDVKTDGIVESTAKLDTLDKTLDDNKKKTDDASESANKFEFSLLTLLPLLIPLSTVLIAATGGVGGLAAAFVTMAPPVALAAYGTEQLYKSVSTLYTGLSASTQAALMNATTLNKMQEILEKNSTAFDHMSKGMQEVTLGYVSMKQVFSQFEQDFQPEAIQILSNGFQDLSTILSLLIDPAKQAGQAISGILFDLGNRLNDPTFQTFFSNMDKNIGTLVTDWGTGVLNIVEGIVGIINAFTPLSMTMSGGFLHMTQSFDTWAQKLATSPGFKKFVADVEKDGPIILGILGNLARFIANVVGALGEQSGSSGFLSFLEKVLKTLSGFTTTHQGLTQVAGDLLLMGVAAIKLAPALGPIIAFLVTPVGAVVGGIIALAAGFLLAYKNSKTFRDWVQQNLVPDLHTLGGDLTQVKTWFISIWPEIQKVWQLYGHNILNIITTDLSSIVTVLGAVIKIIEGIIDIFVGVLTGKWSLVWKGVEDIFSGAWDLIINLLHRYNTDMSNLTSMIGTAIRQNWDTAWNHVKTFLSTTTADIIGDILTFFSNIVKAVVGWGVNFINGINTATNKVKTIFTNLPADVKNWLGNLGGILLSAGEDLISGLITGIENKIPNVSGVLNWITSMLPSWKGPPDKDKDLLYDSGAMIMDGFVNGLESRYSKVQNSLGGLTKTIGNTFGSQFSKDISANVNASLSSSSGLSTGQPGAGGTAGGGASNVTFAAGSIQVNNPVAEPAGTTLTRTLQGVAKWGTIQTPTGFNSTG